MYSFSSRLRSRIGLWSLLLALAALAGTAHAATWIVDSTSADPALDACTGAAGDCSFPGAVRRAAFVNDSIVFTVPFSAATEVEIRKDLVIEAAGARLPRLFITTRGVGWATVTVRNARWENHNSGSGSGGAMWIDRNQIVTIEDSVFLGNRNTNQGGAIFNQGELVVRRTRFEGNFSLGGAGAIHSTSLGTLQVLDSTFRGNGVLDPNGPGRQLGRIGAIVAQRSLDVRGSLFHENESRLASAIWSDTDTRIYNSTFTGNKSYESAEGGTVYLAGPTRIANCTIVGNSGIATGGLWVQSSTSDTQVVNTILANNLGQSPEVFGRIYTYGNNLIRDRGTAVIDIRPGNTNIGLVDPGLAPLANDGGPTLTMQPLPGSPVINAGAECVLFANGCDGFPHVALAVDQRGTGFPRSRAGAVDIGAVEVGAVVVSNAQDSGAGSLRQAIADALPGDLISFARPLFDQPQTIALASTLVVNKPLSILGPGSGLLTLDAGNQRRHLSIEAPATLTLSGMRFTRGNPGSNGDGGAILVNQGTFNADRIVIEDSAANAGGCLYNNGTVELSRARLSGCRAVFSAGLFNAPGRSAAIRDSRIENNIATGPGGAIGNPAGATLLLERVSLSGNRGTIGGALNSYGTATLNNTTFSGNTGDNGGAMYLGGTGTTTLTHATVTLNTAPLNGGIAAEFDAIVNLRSTLIAGNTRTVDQAPDAGGNFTSFGHNLIGNTFATVFRPNSPSLVGNLLNVPARLGALADNGGLTLTHAPLHDSPIIDAGGPGSAFDGRGLQRPVDFTHVANAGGGTGSDIGAFELQVATPTNVVAAALDGALSVGFDGGTRGGAEITGYNVTCGTQSAAGPAPPIVVAGLVNGTAYTCRVVAMAGSAPGIPSALSAPATPSVGVTITSPLPPHARFRQPYTHLVVANSPSPVTFSLVSGALPPGLSLDPASGRISGIPTALGSYTGAVRATNTQGRQATQDFLIQVLPTEPDAPSIGTAVAGDGQIEVYFTPPANDGGSPITSYSALCSSATSGPTSPIVVRNLVNGTPQRCRVFATNAVGSGVASAESNLVTPKTTTQTTVISSATEPAAGEPVTFTASVSPATATGTIDFTIPSATPCGSVPVVNGTASCTTRFSTHGVFNVVATFDGDGSHFGSSSLPLPQSVRPPTITITTESMPSFVGSVGVITAFQLEAAGGSGPYTFALTSGAFPPPLTLSASGILCCQINVAGPYSVTVTATDANGYSGSRTYTGTIIGRPNPPTGVVATPGNAQVSVAFVPPQNDGYSPILRYRATCGGRSAEGTASPISVTGLTNGTPVTCFVIATNAVGNSFESALSASVTPATVPGAPTGVVATRGNAQVSVAFAAPTDNGGSPITGYTASCGSRTQSGAASPLVVSGLTNGVAVTCTVVATNAIGSGAASAPSASVTPATVPGAPTGVVATRGNAQVSVAFAAPTDNGGSAITGYTASCGSRTQSGAASPLVVSGLTNGVAVTCTVVATNAIGSGAASAPSASVTPATVPGAPTGVVATRGNAQVSVAFVAPTDTGGSPITGYTASCGAQSQSGSASPIVVSGLTNGTPVACTVVATNAIGNGPASAPSASVTPAGVPGAPTNVVATRGNAQVSVAFVAPTDTGGSPITDYTASCGAQSQSGSASPIVVSGLTNGTPVICTVVATNAVGNGPASAPSASVTPATVPGAPTAVVATGGSGSATISFAPPLSDGGSAVTGYTARCLPGTASASGTASPLTLTGLVNGTLYTCRVTASNALGSGPESAAVTVVPGTQPVADVVVTASNVTRFVTGGVATTYTVVVRNSGPSAVTDVRVRSVLDADFTAAAWTCSGQGGGLCAASGSGTTLDQRVDLPVGGGVTFLLAATVAALPETPVSIVVSADVPAPFQDPDLQSNVATDGPDVRGLFRNGLE